MAPFRVPPQSLPPLGCHCSWARGACTLIPVRPLVCAEQSRRPLQWLLPPSLSAPPPLPSPALALTHSVPYPGSVPQPVPCWTHFGGPSGSRQRFKEGWRQAGKGPGWGRLCEGAMWTQEGGGCVTVRWEPQEQCSWRGPSRREVWLLSCGSPRTGDAAPAEPLRQAWSEAAEGSGDLRQPGGRVDEAGSHGGRAPQPVNRCTDEPTCRAHKPQCGQRNCAVGSAPISSRRARCRSCA